MSEALAVSDMVLNLEAIFWTALGFTFSRAFGKKLDQGVQSSSWFKARRAWVQGLLKRLLDFLHHWWMGLLLWFYAPYIVLPTGFDSPLHYFGLGWFIDDLPDVPSRFRAFFSYLAR